MTLRIHVLRSIRNNLLSLNASIFAMVLRTQDSAQHKTGAVFFRMSLRVRFWGVRGSIACPLPTHIRYGGNTSCIEIDTGDYRLLLDAGTGIRGAGKALIRDGVKETHVLLTHTHWDHITGFPFFTPSYDPNKRLHFWAGHLPDDNGIQNVLKAQMENPMFPVPLEALRADLNFVDFSAGDAFSLPKGIQVKTAPLNHPNGATGYRVEHDGVVVCYITDTEHVIGAPDQNILGLIEGADLVIYDCSYTDAEFENHIGWGHSTWQEGMRLCRAANVGRMAIFHHDPEHDDAFMERLEAEARVVWRGLFVARDDMEVIVG